MSSILLFNPENDLALAVDRPGYTPPAAAVRLRHAGCLLPMWWAEVGDYILVGDTDSVRRGMELKELYGLPGTPVTHIPPGAHPAPWGWSGYTRRLFIQAGMAEGILPSDSNIQQLRMLSHRRTTIDIHRLLGTPEHLRPVETSSVETAMDTIRRMGRTVIKLPWSSSGRGILYSADIPEPTLKEYIAGIIHRQGSALIEPHFDRIRDFATLYHSDGCQVRYKGLSMFTTDGRGYYSGNIVATQPELEQMLGTDIHPLATKLEQALTSLICPYYRGWLGIDMLLYRDHETRTTLTAPCIEMNLRCTMGVAAMKIASRLPAERRGILLTSNTLPAGAIDLSPATSTPRFILDRP